MTSFLTDCAKSISDKLLDVTIREARYLFCYKCIVEDFEKEKQELEPKLKKVEGDVKDAIDTNEDILEDVEFHLNKGHNLIQEDTKNKRTWFFGWCPNCIWQYARGKELARKAEEIQILKVTSFEKVGRPRQLSGVISQDFIQFQSRDSAYQKLLEAFKDDNNYVVGLYGMGGSGKTTLVKKVGKEVEESKLFDKVVFTVVSNDPDIRKIQNNIASPLSLEFKKDEQEIRAKELLLRLTNGQKILIILDDVWQEFKFDEIGIPSEGYHKGCRVLITSRKSSVCNSMNCQETIPLELLSENEARILFDKHAGIRNDTSKVIKKLAPQIAYECKRLPVAIVAVARSLKNQPPEIWRAALKCLKELKKIGNIDEDLMIYKNVELSYKNLREEKAKKLFLLCSLFPEDYEIPDEDLTRYGIGLGLFGNVNSYEAARIDALYAMRKLLDAFLLLEGEKKGCVKMHDLVRDSAHWMAKDEIQVVMGPKVNATVKEKTIWYLYCNNVNIGFLNQLNCNKLEILILVGEEVPTEEFFEEMKNLKVLTLDSGNTWWDKESWPTIALRLSGELSRNLRTLCLKGFKVGDISFVGTLQGLETLELESCSIVELPNGLVNSEKLKLLSLKACEIERNPYEIISRLSQIEELYFVRNKGWEENIDSNVAANLFDIEGISPDQLKRYRVEIGQGMNAYYSMDGSTSRAIAIEHFDASVLNTTFKDLVQRAEFLHLKEMQGVCRTIIPDFVTAIGTGLTELIELQLDSCSIIKSLVNTTNHVSSELSNLVKLRLWSMDNLEKICYSSPPVGFSEKIEEIKVTRCRQLRGTLFVGKWNLGRLKVLSVDECPMLTSLFTVSSAQNLEQLEELRVKDCEELKCVIEIEEEGGEIVANDGDQKSYGSMLPNLKTLYIERCEKLELICSVCSKSRSEIMLDSKVAEVDPTASRLELQMSNSKCLPSFHTCQCLSRQSLILRNVRKLTLESCPKLMSLFTLSVAQTMLLEELYLRDCDLLKCIIIDLGDNHADVNCVLVFPKLKSLIIENCSQLEFLIGQYLFENQNKNHLKVLKETTIKNPTTMIKICPTNYYATCGPVKQFWLEKCPQFIIKSISDWRSIKELPEIEKHFITLESVQVINCSKVEGIFRLEDIPMIEQQEVMSSRLNYLWLDNVAELNYICSRGPKHIMHFQNLELLMLEGCKELEVVLSASVFRSLPQLTRLTIKDCENLKHIFEEENKNVSNAGHPETQPCFPRLKQLIVQHCNKLKALFTISTSCEFPELTFLFISKASQLEKVFETEAHLKVEFPKLRYLTLVQLDSLTDVCQGIPLQNVAYRFVHNCLKLSLDSTTKPFDMLEKYNDDPGNYMGLDALRDVAPEITSENPKPETTVQGHEDEDSGILLSSKSEVPSSQANEKEETEVEQVLVEQSAPVENKRINDTQKVDKPSNQIQNENLSRETSNKTSLPVLSTISDLKDSLHSSLTTSIKETSPQSVKEEPNETGGKKVIGSEIATMGTLPTESALAERQKTPSNEQKALGQDETPQSSDLVQHVRQSVHDSSFLRLPISPTLPNLGDSAISSNQMKVSRTKSYNGEDTEACPGNLQDFVKVLMPSASIIARERLANKDNLLARIIVADMLQMPLRDIACSKAYILRLQTALHFLSCLSIEDGALSDGLKNVIDSLHHEFPPILCLFKEAFATINKFASTEEREKSIKEELGQQKEADLILVSEISKTKKSLDEALLKKASLKDQITRLQVELELENVNEEMSQMMEGTKIAWQELFTIDHKWVLFCSQFEESWRAQKAISSTDHSNFMNSSVCSQQGTSLQEVGDIQDPRPSASMNAASVPVIKDKLVSNILADLEVYLKMPLKDIATSKVNSLRLQSALQFLSHLSLEDVSLVDGLKATIVSLHHEFPSILSSFKQALASIERFAALEEKEKSIVEKLALQKKATITNVPIISSTERFINEADQEKEASLKEHISRLQVELESKENEIKKCEASLSSLQERQNKCAADTIRLNQEFETVKMEKSQMIEAYRKAREDLFEVDYKWSTLCCLFYQNQI